MAMKSMSTSALSSVGDSRTRTGGRLTLLLAMCSLFALLGTTNAQSQQHTFDVASIKQNTDDPPMMVFGPELRNGQLLAQKVTLRMMLAVAYGVTEPRIVGPGWLDNYRFDIAGRSPKDVPDSELKTMLRTLLEERFKLKSHMEKRLMPVYHLSVAKGGVKMPLYPASDSGPERPWEKAEYRGPMVRGAVTTGELADMLARLVERPVINKTGLPEKYSLFLSFAPLSPQTSDRVVEHGPPELFKALQDQLGLKLQSSKDDVELVVIDQMERVPTAN